MRLITILTYSLIMSGFSIWLLGACSGLYSMPATVLLISHQIAAMVACYNDRKLLVGDNNDSRV